MLKITNNKDAFICPHCGNKLPWKELIQIHKKNYQIVCGHCHTHLAPKSIMSFPWGFLFGFLGFVVPAKTITYLYGNAWYGLIAGIVGGAIVVLFLIIYLYNTTEFIESF